jgi:hypothetical protein
MPADRWRREELTRRYGRREGYEKQKEEEAKPDAAELWLQQHARKMAEQKKKR